ncbi:MAG TPA: hypothetical protein VLG10_02635 [Methylomirabilota bacterium]|nr:hypothetical protein [Methylomirabilota bacterium]
MSGNRLDPEFDPRLVEAAVLTASRGHAVEGEFHAERDRLYEILDLEAREAAFDAHHARWFARLALDQPFRRALAEQPAIAASCGRWLVAGARARDEAADLLVGADVRPTLLVRVTPEAIAVPGRLWRLLRRELQHIADMLDPGFGYEATLPASVGEGPRGRVVRDNYRLLWDAWVDGRLLRRGLLPASARGDRLADFARVFGHLGVAVETVFDRIFCADQLTHRALVAFAAGGPDSWRQAELS